MAVHSNGNVPKSRFAWSKSPRRNPDRAAVERQGNTVFWVTLAAAVLIMAIAGVYALVL